MTVSHGTIPTGFTPNIGSRPGMTEGRRVMVVLRMNAATGKVSGSWPSDGRGALRWSLKSPVDAPVTPDNCADVVAWKLA